MVDLETESKQMWFIVVRSFHRPCEMILSLGVGVEVLDVHAQVAAVEDGHEDEVSFRALDPSVRNLLEFWQG